MLMTGYLSACADLLDLFEYTLSKEIVKLFGIKILNGMLNVSHVLLLQNYLKEICTSQIPHTVDLVKVYNFKR